MHIGRLFLFFTYLFSAALFAISIAFVTIFPQVFYGTFPHPPSCFTWSYTPNSFAISSLKFSEIIPLLLDITLSSFIFKKFALLIGMLLDYTETYLFLTF